MEQFKVGDKVKVRKYPGGCIWIKATIEKVHESKGWYLCGTSGWSADFHKQDIEGSSK